MLSPSYADRPTLVHALEMHGPGFAQQSQRLTEQRLSPLETRRDGGADGPFPRLVGARRRGPNAGPGEFQEREEAPPTAAAELSAGARALAPPAHRPLAARTEKGCGRFARSMAPPATARKFVEWSALAHHRLFLRSSFIKLKGSDGLSRGPSVCGGAGAKAGCRRSAVRPPRSRK